MKSALERRNDPMRFFTLPHGYLVIVVMAICVISYFRTLKVPFYFDDFECIYNNPLIRNFENYFNDTIVVDGSLLEDTVNIFKTRPLSFISFTFNYYLCGYNMGGYHIVNIAIHILNSILIYYLNVFSLNVSKQYKDGDKNLYKHKCAAFMVSCIFAVHPVMTNAVTYITQRMTSFVTLFYLLSTVAYIKCMGCDGRLRKSFMYVLSLSSCGAAMLTKETAFTLPLMLTVVDAILFEATLSQRMKRLTPFIATMLIIPFNVIGLENSEALKADGAIATAINLVNFTGISSHDYFLTQSEVLIFYVKKLLLPIGLSMEHHFPLSTSLLDSGVLASLAVHLLVMGSAVALVLRSRKKYHEPGVHQKMMGLGIIWFYLSLAVESTVIPITEVAVEYRLYLPSIGFFMAAVYALHLVLGRYFSSLVAARIKLWVLCSVVTILMVATIVRNEVWRDPVRFWGKTIAQYPLLCRPYANLADFYIGQNRYEEARNVYRDAITLIPDAEVLHYELGKLYIQAEDFSSAVDEFMSAIQTAPWKTRGYYGLAQAYAFLGEYDRVDEVLNVVRSIAR